MRSVFVNINIENTTCDRLFLSIQPNEDKLQNHNFEFEDNLVALSAPEVQLILDLRDCVEYYFDNDVNMHTAFTPCHIALKRTSMTSLEFFSFKFYYLFRTL